MSASADEDAAREVDDRHAALRRRRVGLAGDAHEPGVRLQQVVVRRLAAPRPVRPKPESEQQTTRGLAWRSAA